MATKTVIGKQAKFKTKIDSAGKTAEGTARVLFLGRTDFQRYPPPLKRPQEPFPSGWEFC